MKRFGIILGLIAGFLLGNAVYATVINVPLGGNIQTAMDGAGYQDTIQLASGTYNITSALYPFGGMELTIMGNGPGVTILDGGGTNQVFYVDVFEALIIESLSVANGSGTDGGGVYAYVPYYLTLRDVEISNCTATTDGGGLYITSGTVTLQRVYFDSNSAGSNGGGMYHRNDWGGTGILCTISKTSFNSNSCSGNGAALYYDIEDGSGNLDITNSTFGNHATGTGSLYLTCGSGGTSVLMKNNTIAHNSTGGLYVNSFGISLTQYNNLIVDNSSYDVNGSVAITIGGDRNLLEVISGGITYNGDNYYESYPYDIVASTFGYNNGGTVPTMDLTDYGIRVAAGRARNNFPVDDQNGITRRSRTELGAIETASSVNVWTGATSTSWQTASNWTSGSIPSLSNSYIIVDNCSNSNYPVSTALTNLSTVDIVVGNFGAFKNASLFRAKKLYLMSNSTGTGQFLNAGTFFGTIETEQYLFGGQWNFLGVPVQSIDVATIIPGATLGTSNWTGSAYSYSAGDYWVFYHDEVERATNGHSDYVWKSVNSGNLAGGPGYIVWCDVPQKAVFVGTVVPTNKNFTLSYTTTGADADKGWNLISNPYLAPFSWVGADISYVDQASYYYNNAFQNYFVIPGDPIDGTTEKIPQVQAFFAKANNSGATLLMSSTLLSIDLDVKFKSATLEDKHYLKTTIFRDSEKYYDETYIRHKEDAGLLFEGKYDAYKLKNFSNVSPQIYTVEGNTDMSINSFSYYDYPTQEVPLMVSVPEIDTYKLAFKIDDSMGDFEYVLEDKQDGTFYNLNDGDTINIYMDQLVEKSRLIVHVVGSSTAIGEEQADEVLMYANTGNLYINTSEKYTIGNVRIYDVAGKVLIEKPINGINNVIGVSDIPSQFVIVNYESNNKRFTKRLFLR
ncbi:hypothetical protein ACE01N_09410 [Saccharicrinis sp. FJH2]|uniref:hypothetical protein n=1 Tax=Saccharicrinis sp. FJH65 TaxID=3344659 RepID=UPI0035F23CFF